MPSSSISLLPFIQRRNLLRVVISLSSRLMPIISSDSKAGMSSPQFLKIHWDVLAATDFFMVEVATWHGLITYYVLVVMELSTRRGPSGRHHAVSQ
jgi:hypothetical protein